MLETSAWSKVAWFSTQYLWKGLLRFDALLKLLFHKTGRKASHESFSLLVTYGDFG